ncbi:MAG: DUF4249 family protein [Candidatus Delongbacteria bacterium]|nr:DUF4249 family protein [Candidatus Delongbacteria bacterium]
MMKAYINLLVLTSALITIMSCETGSSTRYEEKLALYCYAKADSTIDSLYLSRTGGVNESINMENLGLSGATVTLSVKAPSDSVYSIVGILSEYPDKKGIYFLPEADFPDRFITGYSYRIDVTHNDHEAIYAESVCPPELTGIIVKNVEKDAEMVSIEEDPSAVDTLFYRRGESFDDIELMRCRFDSLIILAEHRMASFRIVPDEICRIDTSFWLEDTTETVWEDYPIETRIFKDTEKYGHDFTDYYLRSMSIYWYTLYHEGMHTIVFSATDAAFRNYMESFYGGEERYTNVINGIGLFTLSNSSAVRSRYRIYVRSLENKYP